MWKFNLLIYYAVFLVVAFFWRSYQVWRQTGHNPLVLDTGDAVHRFLGNMFRVSMAVNTAVLLIYAVSDTVYQYLTPITWLEGASGTAVWQRFEKLSA